MDHNPWDDSQAKLQLATDALAQSLRDSQGSGSVENLFQLQLTAQRSTISAIGQLQSLLKNEQGMQRFLWDAPWATVFGAGLSALAWASSTVLSARA